MQGFWGREQRTGEYAYHSVAGYPGDDASEAVEDPDADAETSLSASTLIQPKPTKSLPPPHTSPSSITPRSSLTPVSSLPLPSAANYTTRGTQTVSPDTRVYTAIQRPETPPHVAQTRMNNANLRLSPKPRLQNNIDVDIELQTLQCTHRHRYPPGIVVIKTIADNGEEVVEEIYVDGEGREGVRQKIESKGTLGGTGRNGCGWVGETLRG
ncbi:hypothetical protein IQ07DRAFT_224616 [Pyrenochaeta sp. DS3sAY3a]|nr:hypothetical protein IQ07DRAFT_224616 [Pyrenochaeta sp. DS3sAY3a]